MKSLRISPDGDVFAVNGDILYTDSLEHFCQDFPKAFQVPAHIRYVDFQEAGNLLTIHTRDGNQIADDRITIAACLELLEDAAVAKAAQEGRAAAAAAEAASAAAQQVSSSSDVESRGFQLARAQVKEF